MHFKCTYYQLSGPDACRVQLWDRHRSSLSFFYIIREAYTRFVREEAFLYVKVLIEIEHCLVVRLCHQSNRSLLPPCRLVHHSVNIMSNKSATIIISFTVTHVLFNTQLRCYIFFLLLIRQFQLMSSFFLCRARYHSIYSFISAVVILLPRIRVILVSIFTLVQQSI